MKEKYKLIELSANIKDIVKKRAIIKKRNRCSLIFLKDKNIEVVSFG